MAGKILKKKENNKRAVIKDSYIECPFCGTFYFT